MAATGVASGRLDMMGGVADYSGSLVLECATEVATTVHVSLVPSSDVLEVTTRYGGTPTRASAPLDILRGTGIVLQDVRASLARGGSPSWMSYIFGSISVFSRETGWLPPPGTGILMDVQSTVPAAQGVSSSASIEVAVLRSLVNLSGIAVPPRRLALLAQEAENHVVGAPCGIMDQLAVSFGTPGRVLPILCRPDEPLDTLPLPAGVILLGWPSGIKHSVSGSPYGTARAASFMGKRVLEGLLGARGKVAHVAELSPSVVRGVLNDIPESMTGSEFIARWGGVDDALSVLSPEASYPVRAAVSFPVEENFRCAVVRSLLQALPHFPVGSETYSAALSHIGELMVQGHVGYSSIGLGSHATDRIVAEAMRVPGVYGARVSGGGSGGTVVVLCSESSVPPLRDLAISLATEHGVEFTGFIV